MSAAQPEKDVGRLEAAGSWCLRLAEGPLSSAEQQAFDAWAAEDPENLAALERSIGVWQLYGEAAAAPEFIDVRERALATYRKLNRRRWRTGLDQWRSLASVAACLALFIVGSLWYLGRPDVYSTGTGERRVVLLDDGSRASLDAATEIAVAMRGDRRELTLVGGRAKFDVARDPLRPFSVRAGGKLVVATGTSFSVELLGPEVHVILYEGQVSVLDTPQGGGSAVPVRLDNHRFAEQALTPGRELVADLTRPVAAIAPVDLQRSLSWEAGQLVFVDEPLSVAIGRINRYSQTRLIVAGGAGDMLVNGVFNSGDVDAFLVGIEETLPLQVRRDSDSITISAR